LKAVQTHAKAARSGADTANDGLIDAADVQSPGGPHQTSGDRLTSDYSYRSRKRRRRSPAAAALDNTALRRGKQLQYGRQPSYAKNNWAIAMSVLL